MNEVRSKGKTGYGELVRSKYAGVSVSELKRMKELEAENTAIKDLLSRKL